MQKIFSSITEYLEFFSDEEPPILAELSRETHLKTIHPHMLSGHHQGRLLAMISKLLQPQSILEVGTFTGYSTLCLAEGLPKDGNLITIEHNDELSYFQEKYLKNSDYKNQIEIVLGEAKEEIKKLSQSFDLIFLDADKENYPDYYHLLLPKLKTNGLLLVDNTLWYEKVLTQPEPNDFATQAILKFNKIAKEDPSVSVVILPIRDGLTLIKKQNQ